MDLITAGITCFNAENSIEKAVRSAQAQHWSAVEIVVVDDCSTDDSWAVLERLASDDDRVRIIKHPVNRGVAAARNTVIQNAGGAFIAFFDDDDVSHPERLAEQHRRIVDYERATGSKTVVGYTATEQLYPDGAAEYSSCLGMDITPAPAGEAVARLILIGKPVGGTTGACPTSTQMARREVYDLVDGFDENLRRHEDTDFNLRLALNGAHVAGLSRPLVQQTVTFAPGKSVSAERQNALDFYDKHRDLLQRWKWYNFSRLWCEMKFAFLDGGAKKLPPYLLRLFFMSPVKLARKVMWAFPNRKRYTKYQYSGESRC